MQKSRAREPHAPEAVRAAAAADGAHEVRAADAALALEAVLAGETPRAPHAARAVGALGAVVAVVTAREAARGDAERALAAAFATLAVDAPDVLAAARGTRDQLPEGGLELGTCHGAPRVCPKAGSSRYFFCVSIFSPPPIFCSVVFTSMRLGAASDRLGMRTVSTPSLRFASTFSASADSGSTNDRVKEP